MSYSTSAASSFIRVRNMSWRHSGICCCLVRCTRMHSTQFPWRWQRVCVQGQSSTCTGRRLGARGFFGRPFINSSMITGGASRGPRLVGGVRVHPSTSSGQASHLKDQACNLICHGEPVEPSLPGSPARRAARFNSATLSNFPRKNNFFHLMGKKKWVECASPPQIEDRAP
jgi:hypothetical protein